MSNEKSICIGVGELSESLTEEDGEWEQPADIRAELGGKRHKLGGDLASGSMASTPPETLRMLLAATRDRSQERWDSREQTPLTQHHLTVHFLTRRSRPEHLPTLWISNSRRTGWRNI